MAVMIMLGFTVFTSCEKNAIEEKTQFSNLALEFSSYLFEYNKPSGEEHLTKENLYQRLNHDYKYTDVIFDIMVYKSKTKSYSLEDKQLCLEEDDIKYTKLNEFDKKVIKSVFNDFLSLDASSYFFRMDYIVEFIQSKVEDTDELNFLLNFIDGLKLVKYIALDMRYGKECNSSTTVVPFAESDFDRCFDGCMRKKIEEEYGENWIDHARFLISAPINMGWMVASCTWNCA